MLLFIFRRKGKDNLNMSSVRLGVADGQPAFSLIKKQKPPADIPDSQMLPAVVNDLFPGFYFCQDIL